MNYPFASSMCTSPTVEYNIVHHKLSFSYKTVTRCRHLLVMDSVNSRSELFPNRAFTPPDSVFAMDDDHDPEFQARMPLRHHSPYVRLKARISTSRGRPIPEPSKSSNKRPRKKINETYEPVGTKGRKRTFTDESYSSDGYHRDRCSTLFKILAFVGFFVGLAALALVVMITLGMLSLPSCHDCKKEIVPGSSSNSEAFGSTEELWQIFKELRENVSRLSVAVRGKDDMISQLQRRDLEHTNKIAELERITTQPVFVSTEHRF